ncbi:10832_t:CDS:2 [Rhizophagus irregularis]|nr:10832_t:CDS:2 [Rhizophagus irregularis]
MLENDFDYIGWIEKAVEDNYIPNFDHTKFINKEEIGSRIIKANLSETDTILVVKSGGLKEIVNEFIEGTPIKYSNLYTACWASDPNERPSIQQVVSDLKSIENNEAVYSTKCTTKNEIKKEPPNKDIDYVMDNDHSDLFIDDDFPNSKIDDDVDLNTNDFIQNNLVLNLTDLTDNVERIIDQLIDHLMRMHDEMGYSFMETKQAIDQNIKNINRPLLDKIFDRLIKNQTSSRYIFFHGFLYFNEIIVKRDNSKAFELFSKASKDNCPIVQVYLVAEFSLCDSRFAHTQD